MDRDRRIKQTVKLNLNDEFTAKILLQLQQNTLTTFPPVRVKNKFGSVLVAVLQNSNLQAGTHVVCDNQKNYDYFKGIATNTKDGIALPFTLGTIHVNGLTELQPLKERCCFLYLPSDLDVQPDYLLLPNNALVHLNWDKILKMKNSKTGTLIPYLLPDGQIGYVVFDLKDHDTVMKLSQQSLSKAIPVPDTSVLVFNVLDEKGRPTQTALDLRNHYVINQLKIMADKANLTSDNLVIITLMDDAGRSVPLIFDMDHLEVKTLQQLGQLTSPDLETFYIQDKDTGVLAAVIMVQNPEGGVTPAILDLNNPQVVDELKSMNDVKNSHGDRIYVEDNDRVIELFVDKSNPSFVRNLIKLSQLANIMPYPLLNIDKACPKYYYITLLLTNGDRLVLKFDPKNEKAFEALLKLSKESPANAPYVLVRQPDGATRYLRLDINNPRVSDILQKYADKVTTEKSLRCLMLAQPAGEYPIILDTCNPLVAKKLQDISLSSQYLPGQYVPGLDIFTVEDAAGNYNNVLLNLTDPETLKILHELQENTPSNMNPIMVPQFNGSTLAALIITEDDGTKKAIMIDGSNVHLLEELEKESNMFNPNATEVTVTDGKNISHLYLDLNDAHVKDILKAMQDGNLSIPPLTMVGPGDNDVVIPVYYQNGHESIFKCNLSDVGVRKVIQNLNNVLGKYPITWNLLAKDWSNQIITLDVANPEVVSKLAMVCQEPPRPEDILLVTVEGDQGGTNSFILNTKNPYVVKELIELSNSTIPRPDSKMVSLQVTDNDGNLVNINLDLHDPNTLAELQRLNEISADQIKPILVLPDENGDKTMVIMKVMNVEGKPYTVVLDGKENDVVNILSRISDKDSANAVPIEISTGDTGRVFYIDKKNPKIVSRLILLSRRRRVREPILLTPSYLHSYVVTLPFSLQNEELTIVINLRNAAVKKALKEVATSPSPTTTIIFVKENDGTVNPYYVDLKNERTALILKEVSDKYAYTMKDSTLLIVPVTLSNAVNQYIILDLTNKNVTDALQDISRNFGNERNKILFHYTDNFRFVDLYKVDLNDAIVVKKLYELQEFTLPWITPQLVVSPYGPQPLIVGTIQDTQGHVVPIVLTTADQTLFNTLKDMQTPYPQRDFHVKWPNDHDSNIDIHLDAANPNVVKTLTSLSVPKNDYPRDILTNRLFAECDSSLKSIIAVETDIGATLYSFDTTNLDTFDAITKLASPLDVLSSVVYLCNPNGETTAIHINTRDEDIVEQLKLLGSDTRVLANPTNLLLITIPIEQGGAQPMILDTSNENVVEELKDLSQIKTNNDNATQVLITLKSVNNQPLPVTLDVTQPTIVMKLKQLQQRTPQKILPVLIPSLAGPQPLLLCTLEGEVHETVPIVLDLNNPNVVQKLLELSRPNDTYAFPVEVLDNNKNPTTIYIDVAEHTTKMNLHELVRLCPVFPIPITRLNPNDNLVIPVEEAKGKVLQVVLDITDGGTMTYLRKLNSKNGNLIINVPNQYGVQNPVLIDNRDSGIIKTLKDLGKKFLSLYNSIVIPGRGPLPLITFCPLLINKGFLPVTINPNDQTVMEFLKTVLQHPQNQMDHIRLKLPLNTDYPLIGNIPNVPQTYEGLISASQALKVSVVPIDVTLPEKRIPLLCFLIENVRATYVITIDLEDDTVLDELKYFETEESEETLTIPFNTPQQGKVPVNLNIKDQLLVDKLKTLSVRLVNRIVPVAWEFPMIAVTLLSHEDITLNLNDDTVVRDLISISNLQAQETYPKTEISLRTPDGFKFVIRVAFDDTNIQDQLMKLSERTPVPPVSIDMPAKPGFISSANVIRILPPGHSLYPLITIRTYATGQITIDPNNYQVRTQLRMWSSVEHPPEESLKIAMTNALGDIILYKLDLSVIKIVEGLKNMRRRCPVQVLFKGPPGTLPELVIRHPYKQQHKKKQPLRVDLQRPEVFKAFIDLCTNYNYRNPYHIQIQTQRGAVLCHIDFGDPNVIRAIEGLALDSRRKPHYASFEVPDNMGNIWTIVLDMANDEVVSQLLERSNKTSPSTGSVIELPLPSGKTVSVRLNLYDVNTLNLLKELSQLSTNLPPEMAIKKPKHILEIGVATPQGQLKYQVDINNESVMRKLKRLSAMFSGDGGTVINLPRSDGSVDRLRFDFDNPLVVKNFDNFQNESLTGTITPLIPIADTSDGGEFKQKMLVALNVTSPHYGNLKVVIDLYIPEMIDKLQALSDSFVPGRPETQIPIDDQSGHSLVLRLDVTNPKTIEALALLTEESIGKNPLAGKRLPSSSEVLTAELLTIEVPSGVEVFPITLDISNSNVSNELMRLDKRTSDPILTTISVKTENGLKDVYLNTSDPQSLSDLLAVSTPTTFITAGPKVSLITLIFVDRGDGRPLPIEVDLAERRNVLRLVQISQISQAYITAATYLEVRDDTGQYLRVPVDLSNRTVVNALVDAFSIKTNLNIDASAMPYLVLAMPTGNNGPHKVIKFQTKPRVIKSLVNDLASVSDGIPVQIIDFFHEKHNFNIDLSVPIFSEIIDNLPTAAVINPPLVRHLFIVYIIQKNDDVDPIYLNMHIPRTVEVVKGLNYQPDMPLTLIQYRDKEGQLQYNFLDLTNTDNIDRLMENIYTVGEHNIVKQIRTQKVMLTVPKDGQEVTIALDLSDPKVLREIQDITKETDTDITFSIVEMEDSYGFPVVLKFNQENPAMIDRLLALKSEEDV